MLCPRTVLLSLVMPLVAGVVLMAQEPAPQQASVPGEVILKFSGKSKPGQLAAKASASQNFSDSAVNSYLNSLAKEVGIPFELKQFGSGGNLMVAIGPAHLAAVLQKLVAKAPNVQKAEVVGANDTACVATDFASGTPEAQALQRAAGEKGDIGPDLRAVVEKVASQSGVPLTGSVNASGQLLLTPDVDALIRELAARLSKQKDVEYAVPNFVRGPVDPAPIGKMGPTF